MAGSAGDSTYDPGIPLEKQMVHYKAKDGTMKTVSKAELQEQLESSEKLMADLNQTWEEKLEKTQEVHREREKALEELGITVEKNMVGVHAPKKVLSVCGCVFRSAHEPARLDAASCQFGMYTLDFSGVYTHLSRDFAATERRYCNSSTLG